MEILTKIKPELSFEEKLIIRNKEICKDYMEWYDQDMFKIEKVKDLMARITQKYDLTQQSIYIILKENHSLLEFHKSWEKHKRITEYKRLRAEKLESKKDVVDILEQERKEIEGDSPIIDQSQHLHLTNNINLEEFRRLPVQDKIKDILNRK